MAAEPRSQRLHFNHFLSAYFPDPDYGGKRLFDDMLEQPRAADRLGYRGVTIPERAFPYEMERLGNPVARRESTRAPNADSTSKPCTA